MAALDLGAELKIPDSLALVAAATGNDMLDVMFLCRGDRPYFYFRSDKSTDATSIYFFTKVHPDNCPSSTQVKVYTKESSGDPDEQSQDMPMIYKGKGTQKGSSLTFTIDNVTHVCTYTGSYHSSRQDITINKWSRCKPIRATGADALDFNDPNAVAAREVGASVYGLDFSVGRDNAFGLINNKQYRYERVGSGLNDWARLTDFQGYDPDAKCTLSGKMSFLHRGSSAVRVPVQIYYESAEPTWVDFSLIVQAMGVNADVDELYPAIVAIGVNTLPTVTKCYYLKALTLGDTGEPAQLKDFASSIEKYWNIDISDLPSNLGTIQKLDIILISNYLYLDTTPVNGVYPTKSCKDWVIVDDVYGTPSVKEFDLSKVEVIPVPEMQLTMSQLINTHNFGIPAIRVATVGTLGIHTLVSVSVGGTSELTQYRISLRHSPDTPVLNDSAITLTVNGSTATGSRSSGTLGTKTYYEIYHVTGDIKHIVDYGYAAITQG